ncbi:MAG: hypothetical protein WCD42_07140 [Rhizomicrobium sp.]
MFKNAVSCETAFFLLVILYLRDVGSGGKSGLAATVIVLDNGITGDDISTSRLLRIN